MTREESPLLRAPLAPLQKESELDQPIHFQSATELRASLQRGEISAHELMNATYDRIDALNPQLNALVNLLPRDQALTLADVADAKIARGESGALLGLPMAPRMPRMYKGFRPRWALFRSRIASQNRMA